MQTFNVFSFLLTFFIAGTTLPLQKSLLPFSKTNPVLYDNDDHRDTYTDEYLMALASAGDIQLKGIITSYSGDSVEYDLFVAGRQKIINKARKSGFKHLPDATAGPRKPLMRPASNQFEDTKPLRSAGARTIVAAALQATPSKPLVIIAGGQLTAIADAYLINPLIADRVIVSGIYGALDKTYNAGLDAWAWAIVLAKFRCLSISDSDTQYNEVFRLAAPQTPKARISQELQSGGLPWTAFHEWMREKRHPRHPAAYMERDADGPAAIPLMRPDYITQVERWRCIGIDVKGLPQLVRDQNGPLYLAVKANPSIATEEFWRALKNQASWSRKRH